MLPATKLVPASLKPLFELLLPRLKVSDWVALPPLTVGSQLMVRALLVAKVEAFRSRVPSALNLMRLSPDAMETVVLPALAMEAETSHSLAGAADPVTAAPVEVKVSDAVPLAAMPTPVRAVPLESRSGCCR